MFKPRDHAFVLECKTDKRSSCFKDNFWKTDDKTGGSGKPSKVSNGIWWCSSNIVLFLAKTYSYLTDDNDGSKKSKLKELNLKITKIVWKQISFKKNPSQKQINSM